MRGEHRQGRIAAAFVDPRRFATRCTLLSSPLKNPAYRHPRQSGGQESSRKDWIPASETVVKLEWNAVTPAKAGVERQWQTKMLTFQAWIPAFAGMTNEQITPSQRKSGVSSAGMTKVLPWSPFQRAVRPGNERTDLVAPRCFETKEAK